MEQAIGASTRNSYETAMRSYVAWCARAGHEAEVMSVTTASACNWLTWLHEEGTNSSTIAAYKSGLRTLWLEAAAKRAGQAPREPPWDSVVVTRVLQGIARASGPREAQAREDNAATPLYPQMFEAVWGARGAPTVKESMMYAAAACAIWGGMRPGEVIGERMGVNRDVRCRERSGVPARDAARTAYLTYHLRMSKTDQQMRGREVTIAGGTPIAAWWAWTAARPLAERGASRPLFQLGSAPLRLSELVAFLERRLRELGFGPVVIKGRSFRRGAASAEAAAGADREAIQRAGRWASGAFARYVEPAAQRQAVVARARSAENQE